MAYTPSISAKPGRDFLLKASTQLSPTNFVVVGGLRDVNFTLNNNPVDITNFASEGFRELLADGGVQQFSLAGNGIFDSLTAGADALWEAARLRTVIECQLISGHLDQFIGYFVVGQFVRTGAVADAEGFSIQLESTGTLAYFPAP